MSPPEQHAAVERLRGTMTKHSFIAYRDDRKAESQPITFDGRRLARLGSIASAVDPVYPRRPGPSLASQRS
jgi:hypothetical protein